VKIHIVKPGDTLDAIAQKYGIALDKLIAANPQLEDPDRLTPGMKIRIPVQPAAVAPADGAGPTPAPHTPGLMDSLETNMGYEAGVPVYGANDANSAAGGNVPNPAPYGGDLANQPGDFAYASQLGGNVPNLGHPGMNDQSPAALGVNLPNFAPLGANAPNPAPFGDNLSNVAPFGANASNPAPFGANLPNLAPFGDGWPNLAPLGENAPNAAPFVQSPDPFGMNLPNPGLFGQSLPNVDPMGPAAVPFQYDPMPAVPVSSLYDMPAVANTAVEPWGMPYPQMNAHFHYPPATCGCAGAKPGKDRPYDAAFGWPGNAPYSHWLPYARPVQYPDDPPQGGSVHEARLADEAAVGSDGAAAKPQAKTSQASAGKTAKPAGRRSAGNKSTAIVAKIRRLSKGSGKKQTVKKREALPWMNH
jgi:morphogenetic protein associated with SpoVID